jgi:hypothetical protein
LPPPPGDSEFYEMNNLIIDEDGEAFFYKTEIPYINSCITDDDVYKPRFISLKPIQIKEIPENSVERFVMQNITAEHNHIAISIASAKDTFHSHLLSKIVNILGDEKNNNFRYRIRRMTEEEKIVLEYKKSRKPYYSNAIKLDSTKIKN